MELPSPPPKAPSSAAPKSWSQVAAKGGPPAGAVHRVGAAVAPAAPASSLPKGTLSDIKHDQLNLSTALIPIPPRGLVNPGNYCFMNAVLQGLLASPPFYRLLVLLRTKNVPPRLAFLDALYAPQREFPEGGTEDRPLFADYMLQLIDSRFNKQAAAQDVVLRRQEDAHEFLTFLLDGLHGELSSLRKDKPEKKSSANEEWNEVGRKQKVATMLVVEYVESAITWIFGSRVKSVVRREGGKASGRLEPMTCMPLDIAPPQVQTLEDAISLFLKPERLQGFTDSATASLINASKHTQLERLPPILILQLKRFGFEGLTGSHKLNKFVPFPLHFQLPPDFLAHPNVPAPQRSYTLLAVISHHGSEAGRGHYTADVRRAGGRWASFDDARFRLLPVEEVLERRAYLLFYALDA